MMMLKRAKEGGMSLDYLRGLHEKHESWLLPFQSGNQGVLSFSQMPTHVEKSIHPDIRDRVFYLEGSHLCSSIQKVPALVLDCKPNIDFSKDIEAKREYARQVAEFFKFVKRRKEEEPPKTGTNQKKSVCPRIMLPQETNRWVPNGGHFDFRKAISFSSV